MAHLQGQIKAAFDAHCEHATFDNALFHRIIAMQEGFVNKKREHVEFFGGTLTGVQVVRFTDADRDILFDSILQVDEDVMEHALYNLKNELGHPVIDQTHARGSDVFNNACIYIIHRLHHAEGLDENHRMQAKVRICTYMIYKFLTSLMYHYFQYPANPEVAQATYARLSMKFSLKQYGSWNATLMNLAANMVGPNSVHRAVIETMEIDGAVERMINDVQSRIKDMLKNIYSVFMEVHNAGDRVSVSGLFSEIEGEIELKDKTKSLSMYGRYLKGIISDKDSFIKPELVGVITSMMHTLSPHLLQTTLQWTSEHYFTVKDGTIDKAVDVVMEHALDYLAANRDINTSDLGNMLDRLRGAYMSSRSTDPRLLDARKRVEEIVKLATKSKNNNAISAVRTAWMLYVVSRAYTMRYYSAR